MKRSNRILAVVMLSIFAFGDSSRKTADDLKLPVLPNAALLTGYPPAKLFITSPKSTLTLQADEGGSGIQPTMSREGLTVASAFYTDDGVPHTRSFVSLATYSVLERKWTRYKQLEHTGTIAISPDGTRLAYAAREHPDRDSPVHIYIIDLNTKKETVGPVIGRHDGISLTWSPDGRRIAFDMFQISSNEPVHERAILILDLETHAITKIADGSAPTWAPSGEWIAFFTYSQDRVKPGRGWGLPSSNRVMLIRPDGSGSKVITTLPGKLRAYIAAPVWSPDSSRLLVNEVRNPDKWTMDVQLIDLSTAGSSIIASDTQPVYAWSEARD